MSIIQNHMNLILHSLFPWDVTNRQGYTEKIAFTFMDNFLGSFASFYVIVKWLHHCLNFTICLPSSASLSVMEVQSQFKFSFLIHASQLVQLQQ